jgi:hypothetical protein
MAPSRTVPELRRVAVGSHALEARMGDRTHDTRGLHPERVGRPQPARPLAHSHELVPLPNAGSAHVNEYLVLA